MEITTEQIKTIYCKFRAKWIKYSYGEYIEEVV